VGQGEEWAQSGDKVVVDLDKWGEHKVNMITDISVFKEVGTLLYWSMLAACSVGPGTVVVCARAGAEYGLSLSWSLLVASCMAFVMLEASARLTIVSGKSLGECLRTKYATGPSLMSTPAICWAVTICICLGNQFYELNTFAGGLDAVLALPGTEDLQGGAAIGLRVGTCVAYATVVMALLWLDKTELLGVLLGIVMCGMVGLFFVVVAKMNLLSIEGVAWGLVPNIPPRREEGAEPADLVISLVSTTAVGFNLFLGGAMASNRDLRSAQRGIAFSCAAAFIVSLLILMVGAGSFIKNAESGHLPPRFTIPVLSGFVREFTGEGGVIVFAIGFIAAALSSQLATPLGATATAESMFFRPAEKEDSRIAHTSKENVCTLIEEGSLGDKEKDASEERRRCARVRCMKQGINIVMVSVAAVVISTNVDRMGIILVAQVFNGCLLPIFSVCLLLCVNDRELMQGATQKWWANIFLFFSVLFTLFLASNVIVLKAFSSWLPEAGHRQLVSLGLATGGMLLVCLLTSLGKDILASCCTTSSSSATTTATTATTTSSSSSSATTTTTTATTTTTSSSPPQPLTSLKPDLVPSAS